MNGAMKHVIVFGLPFLALAGASRSLGSVSVVLHDQSPSWGYLLTASGTIVDPRVTNPPGPWLPPPGSFPTPPADEHGTPVFHFDAGVVTFDAGKLLSITINYESPQYRNLWSVLKPGDLFLDVGNDGKFDYVVRTPFYAQQNYYDAGTLYSANSWRIYKLNQPEDYLHDRDQDNPVYQLAYNAGRADSSSSGWPGLSVRDYHPWAVKPSYLTGNATQVGSAAFDGWDNLAPANSVGSTTWTFADFGLDIPLYTEIGIGFTVNCANDVLLGYVTYTPEPGALVVWGLLGLLAAGCVSWRRRTSRQA
jgi:hypothetical protein